MRRDEAVVSSLWWFEVRNILIVNERRGRIAEPATAAFLLNLARLCVSIDRGPEEASVLRLARIRWLPLYDAAYLELAPRGRLPLPTLDRAAREGVALFPPASA